MFAGGFSMVVFIVNIRLLFFQPPLDDFVLREMEKLDLPDPCMEKICNCSEALQKQEEEKEEKIKTTTEEEEDSPTTDNDSCKPVTKIAFAKTHKTGSSTIQNILLRYGVKNDLVFALPANSWMFKLNTPFNSSLVLDGPWAPLDFDIFAFHCLWRHKEVARMIPEARYITILREPLSLFESGYVYFGLQRARGLDINGFAEKWAAKGEPRHPGAYIGRNNLIADMGVDAEQVADMKVVDETIKYVNDNFDLVMIMERFEESLVLLADAFCWSLEDVMYIKQNERVSEIKTVPTEKTKEIMRVWLEGDYKVLYIYVHSISGNIKHNTMASY